MKTETKTQLISLGILLLTAMIWGFAFVAQVTVTGDGKELNPFTFNAIRFGIGAVSLIPVICIFERGKKPGQLLHTILYGAVTGGVLFIASTLQQYGAELTGSSGVSGFITGLYIVLTPVFYFLIFHRKTSVFTWLGVLAALIGLFFLCVKEGQGFTFGRGELLLLIGAFFWAGHILIVDQFVERVSPLRYSAVQFATCSLFSVIGGLITGFSPMSHILNSRVEILYCGLFSVGIAYTLQVIAQKRADPTYAAIILSTESLFSAVGGAIFGIDRMTVVGYIGCLFMFTGIILSQIKKRKTID